MKISARNALKGTLARIDKMASNAELSIEVAPGVTVYSTVSLESVDQLELEEGQEIWAAFEASDVMVGVPHHKRGE